MSDMAECNVLEVRVIPTEYERQGLPFAADRRLDASYMARYLAVPTTAGSAVWGEPTTLVPVSTRWVDGPIASSVS